MPSVPFGLGSVARVAAAPVTLGAQVAAGPLRDLRAIADSVSVLPRLLGRLDEISESVDRLALIAERVERLDREVVEMHQAVEGIRADVVGMTASVARLAGTAERFGLLAGRFRRRGTVAPVEPLDPAAELPPPPGAPE